VLGRPVTVPSPGEYVALGAARQAAWVLDESPDPPPWSAAEDATYEADLVPAIRDRYAEARDKVLDRA
jgi:xylulokinase